MKIGLIHPIMLIFISIQILPENIQSMQKFYMKLIFVSLIVNFLSFKVKNNPFFLEKCHVTIWCMVAMVTMILRKNCVFITLLFISRKTIDELI